ncbi:MAG TPA: hypothetical protein PLR37_05795 [Candidatus Accumulibacter phosphatis]|nr:hypothetical protein [Accumulibacter sp.]HRF11636.1 hypothetical protein [Candidatus Accumulibacter phosphatis]
MLHSRAMRILFAALCASLALDAAATGVVLRGELLIGAPFGWTVPPPSIVYDSYGHCLSAAGCPNYEQLRRFLDRYERNYGHRFAPNPPALLVPVQPRDVPPTPEAHIQPRYRGASQIRPEFEQAGKPVYHQ